MKKLIYQLLGSIFGCVSCIFYLVQIEVLLIEKLRILRIGVLASIAERAGLENNTLGLIFPTLLFIGLLFNFIPTYFTFKLQINRAIYYSIMGELLAWIPFSYFSIFYYAFFALDTYMIGSMILIFLHSFSGILVFLRFFRFRASKVLIRDILLDYSLKIENLEINDIITDEYFRYKVKDISRLSQIDEDTIIYLIKKMVRNNEIKAAYFKRSRTLVFKHKADTDKFNILMSE